MRALLSDNKKDRRMDKEKSATNKLVAATFFGGLLALTFTQASIAQETLAPPSIGEDTKGAPAVIESLPLPSDTTVSNTDEVATDEVVEEENYGPLGQATITETRRESGGNVTRIELEHSIGGGKQILEENDSDGKLETRSTGLEEEVNIPKWRIGSW